MITKLANLKKILEYDNFINKSKNKKTDKTAKKLADNLKNKAKSTKVNKSSENSKLKVNKPKIKEEMNKSKSEEDTNDDTQDVRKWNDHKNRDMKKGTFTEEEGNIIINALCQYAFENQIAEGDILKLVTEKQSKTDKSIWPKIAEILPSRSVQSVHNYCHRVLNPNNYKGEWTDEDVNKLLQ